MEGTESGATEEQQQEDTSSSAKSLCVHGVAMDTTDVEAKLDTGNISDAETSLREGLALSQEEARAILGRVEYERGNFNGALQVIDGIDFVAAAIDRLQPSTSIDGPSSSSSSRRGRSRSTTDPQSQHSVSQHSANLLLEGMLFKSMSLQQLRKHQGKSKTTQQPKCLLGCVELVQFIALICFFGLFPHPHPNCLMNVSEAAEECRKILDSVEKVFPTGIPEAESKLQETVSKAVELLPQLCLEAGCHDEAIESYRRALLGLWNLDNESRGRLQKKFAVFLLHGGIEASAPNLAAHVEGSFVPKNNLEEAILLLMILLSKCYAATIKWDPSIVEHLTFALSLCGKTLMLAKQLEEALPGTYDRCFRWYLLALSYSADGDNISALNLLRKSLIRHEKPNDSLALLLAAHLCSEDSLLASEGAGCARRLIENGDEYLKGAGLHLLGVCLRKQAKFASSDLERSVLLSEALKSLEAAALANRQNPDLLFELGLTYAESHNTNAALRFGKEFIDATGGSVLKGWRLLALALSAQQRYSEAEVVVDAALDETVKWESAPLLRVKAKLKIAQSLHMEAVETYRFLLALVQAQRKSFGSYRSTSQAEEDNAQEFEVWNGLASLYSSLKHWEDAEICLDKARALKEYSADMLHTEGKGL
ncbi:hypothetical protein ACLOJK_015685 [Asimina triloba]